MNVVVLSGAGISAESGVPTFRDANGLWEGHDIMAVATPEGFHRDPVLVHRFYDARRRALGSVEPNAAHRALARWQASGVDEITLVTQNVDDLHERAGSEVLHMHGELRRARCLDCAQVHRWHGDLGTDGDGVDARSLDADSLDDGRADSARPSARCPDCGGGLRPHIVWFGEMPFGLERIEAALARASLFVAIGTSGEVYPAAGFVDAARRHGARTLEINLVRSGGERFDEVREGLATREVQDWVAERLARGNASS